MAQGDLNVANQSGAAFRADLNNQLAALGTLQSGASEPSTTYAYMLWADTTAGQLKQRNAANNAWVVIGTLGSANLGLATLASPTFTGTVTIPAGASISGFAPLASPTFTGTPAAPTASSGTNTTQVATTAFVLANSLPLSGGTLTGPLSVTDIKNPSSGSNNITLGTDGSTRISTLADSAGANTSTPAEIASGRAKAWVNFNGTGTVAIRASYNVSSITDNGTGDYTMNFTTALADTNYSTMIMCNLNATGNSSRLGSAPFNQAATTGSIRMQTTLSSSTGAEDMQFVNVAIFR